ncbi:nucleotide sugar dehydrogenase [Shouchella shacheensis]|uniref:nucleotide sugar dehydrogenase n=1 Tax=Shouchella shacheensis TaxID=1649580 RepID=UPI00073FF184|nr:nucleotide sugar dehydrogenase [Shouchella shacheensis]
MHKEKATQTVCVVGLGKIGLTLAAVYANNGFNVIGADVNDKVVSTVNQGQSHVANEPGLDELVLRAFENKRLRATLNTKEAVSKSTIVVVIVPVLVDEQNDVDYSYIDSAVEEIAKGVKKNTTIIFETTLPPGDTKNRFGKRIEDMSGLKAGNDFYLAYSPERVYSNHILSGLEKYPKVVGGLNEKSLQIASAFYKKALQCEVIEVDSTDTAEFSKVAECVYRDVNIALANELAKFADEKGVKLSDVIKASNSQPYSHIHSPGIGVGGHCIPIYPYFFMNRGLKEGLTHFSREVNDGMAEYAISKIENQVGALETKNILILGLSYRGNVKEATKSTTWLLTEQLKKKNANVFVHDPMFTEEEIKSFSMEPLSLGDPRISTLDIVILQAFHSEYQDLRFEDFTNCKLIFDGRNEFNKEDITRAGITYEGLGG